MSSGSQIRCNGCRGWFTADNYRCPECDHPRPGFSKPLATAKVNGQLYTQLASAEREKKLERSLGLS